MMLLGIRSTLLAFFTAHAGAIPRLGAYSHVA